MTASYDWTSRFPPLPQPPRLRPPRPRPDAASHKRAAPAETRCLAISTTNRLPNAPTSRYVTARHVDGARDPSLHDSPQVTPQAHPQYRLRHPATPFYAAAISPATVLVGCA